MICLCLLSGRYPKTTVAHEMSQAFLQILKPSEHIAKLSSSTLVGPCSVHSAAWCVLAILTYLDICHGLFDVVDVFRIYARLLVEHKLGTLEDQMLVARY